MSNTPKPGRDTQPPPLCQDCNEQIDPRTIAMFDKARAQLGQPPKPPARCARCLWTALKNIPEDEGQQA